MNNFFWSYIKKVIESGGYGMLYNWFCTQQQATVEYGDLYNWYAATDSRNICSNGWSLPTNAKFNTLISTVGTNPGYALTEANLSYWTDITGCTNSSGFNGRGSGNRAYTTGAFNGLKGTAAFWTSTVVYSGYGCSYGLYSSNHSLFSLYDATRRADGCAIRPVKDSTTLTNGQTGTYVDPSGIIYPTICIGTQEWVACNIMTKHYRNGDAIPEITDNTAWSNATTGMRCSYLNIEANAGTTKKISSSDSFIVPTSTIWDGLQTHLGGELVAGGKLKETGLNHWNSPNTGATNEVYFNGVGSGRRDSDGFSSLNEQTEFWTNESNGDHGICYELRYDSNYFSQWEDLKENGWSLRLCNPNTLNPEGSVNSYTQNDGTIIPTIVINGVEWTMNLKETKWSDGTDIQNITDNTAWAALTTGARCVYNNDESNM